MEVNLKDIDDDLKDIKVAKKPGNESDNSSPEGVYLMFFSFVYIYEYT